jgi:hypothetical protein
LAALLGTAQFCAAACDTPKYNTKNYRSRGNPLSVAVGDLNGDSKLDFVIPSPGIFGDTVAIFYGDGTGRFSEPFRPPVGDYPHGLMVADFNGDGFDDLAVLTAASLEILLSKGDGRFAPPISYPEDGVFLGGGEFNGDGNQDLVVVDSTGSVNVYIGVGDGTFSGPIASTDIPDVVAMTTGDFDEDGFTDLATSDYANDAVHITHGDGAGHFTVINTYSLDSNGGGIATADFNHDGHLDLAVGTYNILRANVRVFLGAGDGTLTPGERVRSFDPQAIVTADFDSDGNIDFAAANYSSDSSVTFAFGDGLGGFPHPVDHPLPGRGLFTIDLASADFDGDGTPDLVTANFIDGSATALISAPCEP